MSVSDIMLSCNDISAVLCEANEHGVESSEDSKLIFLAILRLLSISSVLGGKAVGIFNLGAQYWSPKARILAMRDDQIEQQMRK